MIIINNNERLKTRLHELCTAFEKSGYPKKMLMNMSTKILNMRRDRQQTATTITTTTTTIPATETTTTNENQEENISKPILVVSTHGTDDKLTKTLKSFEEDILKTNSFKKARRPLFQFVKKTGANIGSKLSVLRSLALGNKVGTTSACFGHGNCKCCLMIDEPNVEQVNGIPVTSAPGNCKTKNTIYLVTCRLCLKSYIGRTVQPLADRMSGHRACYYKVLRKHTDVDSCSDDYSLGLHIAHDHRCIDQEDFSRLYRVQVLENCSPSSLEKKEHCYIHKYNTLFPVGLNKTNPFGLPILR
jgi:hypothetical protein